MRFDLYNESFTEKLLDYSKQMFDEFSSLYYSLKFDKKFLEALLKTSQKN